MLPRRSLIGLLLLFALTGCNKNAPAPAEKEKENDEGDQVPLIDRLNPLNKVRDSASRAKSKNNLRLLIIAMHMYNSDFETLPIGGIKANGAPILDQQSKPLLSWRVALLPLMEQQALYNAFHLNEPWDSPHNLTLIDKMPSVYKHPSATSDRPGTTRYQMIAGPAFLKPGKSIQAIPDGSSNTIIIAEAANPVIWTKPDDITISDMEMPSDLLKYFSRLDPYGFHVAMGDASIYFFPYAKLDLKNLWLLMRPDDGMSPRLP